MSRPSLPVDGDGTLNGKPYGDLLREGIWTAHDKADQALAIATANQAGGFPGGVFFDTFFAGATDEAKMTSLFNFMNQASLTRRPPVYFGNRDYVFAQTRAPYDGMRWIFGSGPGPKNPEIASGKNLGSKITLNCGSGLSSWLVPQGDLHSFYIGDGAFVAGNSGAQFWDQTTSVAYPGQFHSLSFVGFAGVLGSKTRKMVNTQITKTGHWTALGQNGTQFNEGGSDDYSPWYLNAGGGGARNGAGDYLVIYDAYGKATNLGYHYLTCNGGWRGVLIRSTKSNGVVFNGGAFEGMNAGAPCDGNVIRIEGGIVRLRDVWTAYAMANPLATEHGVIEVTGGHVVIDGCMYGRGNLAEDVPWVYQSGGHVVIRDAAPDLGNATWAGKPRFKSVGGTYSIDTSVQLAA